MSKRSEALQTVLNESMEWAKQLPIARRASLYRGLAEVCGDPQEAANLKALADSLESLDLNCQRLQFELKFDGGGKR